MVRTPNIFLTPKKLDERANQAEAMARVLPAGLTRDCASREAKSARRKAKMKRYVGFKDRDKDRQI